MNSALLIGIGFIAGALAMFSLVRIRQASEKAISDLHHRIDLLEQQIKGKQLPFHVRDGLEEIKALENYDAFDLARIRIYLEEAIKSVDSAAERQKTMGTIYDGLRNGKKK